MFRYMGQGIGGMMGRPVPMCRPVRMALTNHSVTGVRTVYLPCRADRGFISSRFVREIARYRGAVTHMVPQPVADALAELFPSDPDHR